MADQPMWSPSAERVKQSNVTAMMTLASERWGIPLSDYDALWRWSIDQPEQFWPTLWDYCGVISSERGDRVLVDGDKMPGARFFPDARLNFAENLLRLRDDSLAIIFQGEDQVSREMTWAALYDAVSRLSQAFRAEGIVPGDRIAAYMPNMPETIIAMLAATSIGAVFTSASPDFGVQGVLDRFGQVEPKILIAADGYYYGGKSHDSLGKLPEIAAGMPTVKRVLIVPYTRTEPDVSNVPNGVVFDAYSASYDAEDIVFTQLGFNDPAFIMYSSGTTGVPKCIVHSVGGVLLTNMKEHRFMVDTQPGDRVFWFTTCGWMMWNWLVGGLASEATVVLYDGSPFYPDGNVLFDLADKVEINMFGVSAKFIDACNKAGLAPGETHSLASVRTIGSTGSVLVPEGYDYIYDKVKADVHLASVSGGTDILGCFVGGNPIGAVYRGEIQAPCLGMAVDVFGDGGKPVRGEKGEFVCTRPFPSMPIGFWNDPDGSRYFDAYYGDYPNIWRHGDWVQWTDHNGLIFFGRSDATLNPGGVRIGTAEIYRQVEKLNDVVEGIVIGQDWDDDTRVVLFVVLRPGLTLDEALISRIKKTIRENATPRHVPARVLQVPDIPRTKSGKIVELAVRNVVHGEPVKNKEALANPEALDHFANRPELAE